MENGQKILQFPALRFPAYIYKWRNNKIGSQQLSILSVCVKYVNIPIIDKMFGKKYQKSKYRSLEDFLTQFPFVSNSLTSCSMRKVFWGFRKTHSVQATMSPHCFWKPIIPQQQFNIFCSTCQAQISPKKQWPFLIALLPIQHFLEETGSSQ